jgi:hypothetical protein
MQMVGRGPVLLALRRRELNGWHQHIIGRP